MSLTEQMVLKEIRRLNRRDLRLWVSEGWVRPAMGESGPIFDDLDVARLRLLCDLRKEMALPTDAVPVALSLIDRLHQTRRDLRLLMQALEDQPRDVQHSVRDHVRARSVMIARDSDIT